MTTPYSLLCQSCGLSSQDAARYLSIRRDTAAAYWLGKINPPGAVLQKLKGLQIHIRHMAREAITHILRDFDPPYNAIQIRPLIGHSALSRAGLPCRGSHDAVLQLVITAMPAEWLPHIQITSTGRRRKENNDAD